MSGVGDPLDRDDLFAVPVAAVQVEQREASEIARGHAHGVGGIAGFLYADVGAVLGTEVLHADGRANLVGEALVDGSADRFLVDGAEGVEVPVVVVPEGAGGMAAALGPLLFHAGGLICGDVVDAAARL